MAIKIGESKSERFRERMSGIERCIKRDRDIWQSVIERQIEWDREKETTLSIYDDWNET